MKPDELQKIARDLAKKFGRSYAARAWQFVSPGVRAALLDAHVMDHARLRDESTKMTIADLVELRRLFERVLVETGRILEGDAS